MTLRADPRGSELGRWIPIPTGDPPPPSGFGNYISQRRDGATTYHHFDGVGSTRELTDSAQVVTDDATYKAFGETVAETGATPNPHQWVGEQGYYHEEATGRHLLTRRRYESAIGRFLSQDPPPPEGSADLNRYLYAGNNPLNITDPNGLGCTADGEIELVRTRTSQYGAVKNANDDLNGFIGLYDEDNERFEHFISICNYTASFSSVLRAILCGEVSTKKDWDQWFKMHGTLQNAKEYPECTGVPKEPEPESPFSPDKSHAKACSPNGTPGPCISNPDHVTGSDVMKDGAKSLKKFGLTLAKEWAQASELGRSATGLSEDEMRGIFKDVNELKEFFEDSADLLDIMSDWDCKPLVLKTLGKWANRKVRVWMKDTLKFALKRTGASSPVAAIIAEIVIQATNLGESVGRYLASNIRDIAAYQDCTACTAQPGEFFKVGEILTVQAGGRTIYCLHAGKDSSYVLVPGQIATAGDALVGMVIDNRQYAWQKCQVSFALNPPCSGNACSPIAMS